MESTMPEHTITWTKKTKIITGVTSIVIVLVVLIGVLSWYFTKDDESSTGSPVPPVIPPVDPPVDPSGPKSKILVGVVMAPPSGDSTLPLSKIIDDIDIFWDWKNKFTQSLYDSVTLTQSNEKYIPMNWYFLETTIAPDKTIPYPDLLKYIETAKPKYVFSWNEPDILGSWQDENLTSCGGVVGGADNKDFPFGNAVTNLTTITQAKAGLTAFPGLATILESQATDYESKSPGIIVATPVMAVGVKINCSGFKSQSTGAACVNSKTLIAGTLYTGGNPTTTAFETMTLCTQAPTGACLTAHPDDYNGLPLYNDGDTCKSAVDPVAPICNGWLQLTKSLAPPDNTWWEKSGIINIHCYNRLAHLVKLHILEYMTEFSGDLIQRNAAGVVTKPGKEIWLTETACLYSSADILNETSVKVSANFLRDLLWKPTKLDPAQVTCSGYSDTTTSLPGLYTLDAFTFNTKAGSWYEHGFGAFTWFSDPAFASFATGCFTDFIKSTLNSDIFTDGQPNEIFDVLTGKQR